MSRGRRSPRKRARGAKESARSTDKRRARGIPPRASRASGGARLRPRGAGSAQRHEASLGSDEVDGDGHAFEPKAPAQLVLDPVGVVARDEPPVAHEEPEARGTRADLRPVEEIQPAPAPCRWLPRLAQLAQG